MVSGGNFAVTLLLGRFLGPDDFGLFSVSWMVILGVSSLQQAYLLTPMLTLFPQQKPAFRSTYLCSLAWMELVGIVVLLVVGSVWDFIAIGMDEQGPLTSLIFPTTLALVGHQVYDFVRKTYLVQENIRQVQWFDGTVLVLQLLGLGALIGSQELSPATGLYALAAAYFLPSAIPFFQLLGKIVQSNLVQVGKQHWEYGRWLVATALLQWVSGNFFVLAGGLLLGTTAMGAIRMGQTLIGILNPLLLALENFVPTRAAKVMETSGRLAMGRYLIHMGWKSALLFFPFLIGMALGAPTIIDLAFGAKYLPYTFVLRGFALLYCFVFAGTLLRYYFRTTGATREIFLAYVGCTLASLVLSHPFVSAWGLYGVLAGLLLSQGIICGWLFFRIPSFSISTSL